MVKLKDLLTRRISEYRVWDFFSLSLISILFSLLLSRWFNFPIFMDCYYHLSTMEGFREAGGWVGRAFWEYAPEGRPHLYPPLFHILELALRECGMGLVNIARFSQVTIYPVFLLTCWFVMRRLYSSRFAFFVVLLLGSSFPLYLSVVILIPFSLAFIFGLLSFYYFEQKRCFNSFLFLCLAFYAHNLMAAIALLSLVFYSFITAKCQLKSVVIGFSSILTALPLLLYQLKFREYVRISRVLEFYYVHINLLLCLLAFLGIFFCCRRRRRSFFFVSFFAAFVILAFIYRNRIWSGQGLIPFVFLSALALDSIWEGFKNRPRDLRVISILCASVFFVLYLFAPTLEFTPFKKSPSFFFSSRISLKQSDASGMDRVFVSEETFYHPVYVQQLVDLIRANSKPDDLLYTNFNYAGGMLGVLSQRATSSAMLPEVRAFKPQNELAAAKIIVWFKEVDGRPPEVLYKIKSAYGLKEVGETEIACVFVNDKASGKKQVASADISKNVCFGLLILCLFVFLLGERKMLAAEK